jgi:hypothetical protein
MHGDLGQNATLESLQFHFIIFEESRPRYHFPPTKEAFKLSYSRNTVDVRASF